ncbi:MAG: hypothetical protein IKY58_04335 [Paludibacteraceae bacterium]|jgi:hypothetical protein|nr:hypothetical protein [Paludibacteraceae bacterium]
MIKQIFRRIYDLLFYPQPTWEKIRTENIDGNKLRREFYLPLILMVIVCAVLGSIGSFLQEVHVDFVTLFLRCMQDVVVFFSAYFLGFFVMSLFLNELLASHFFNIERNLQKCFTFFAYSSVLMWCIKALVLLFPNLIFLYLLNFYAFYLVWTGGIVLFDKLKGDQTVRFTLIATVLLYFIPMGIEWVMLKLIS